MSPYRGLGTLDPHTVRKFRPVSTKKKEPKKKPYGIEITINMNKQLEQKIKDAADIVEVVGEFTTLRKKGVSYVGLCPMHDDRTIGSFAVDPRRNICSCWACGKTGLDPIAFLKEKGMTYKEALLFIAKQKHIDVDGDVSSIKIEPRKELPPLETIYIDKALALKSMKVREQNTLVRWLRSLHWDACQRKRIDEVLWLYAVGEYATYNGDAFTAFWQADEKGMLRSGKLMCYKENGHRNKEAYPYRDEHGNEVYHSQDFVHSQLRGCPRHKDCDKCHKYQTCPYPRDKYDYKATLYGMHLLNRYPGATVNIVESEKTALIMSIAYGIHCKSIWMATGGMQNLRREILQPIIEQKRDIFLYPDKDGVEQWTQRMELINYKYMALNTGVMRTYWKESDGPKADIADIIVRLIEEPTTMQDVITHYPGVKPLIDKLELECIK